MTPVIISCTMPEAFERYPVGAYNELVEDLNRANRLVNRGHQLAHNARENMNMLRETIEQLPDDGTLNHAKTYTAFRLMLLDAEKDVQATEKQRRQFRAHYLKLLRKQRAIARRRLLFMHRSRKAPWRGARR